jgi:hypothetical protein
VPTPEFVDFAPQHENFFVFGLLLTNEFFELVLSHVFVVFGLLLAHEFFDFALPIGFYHFLYGVDYEANEKKNNEQMGHASFQTTRQYVKYAELQQNTPYNAFLPAVLQPTGT